MSWFTLDRKRIVHTLVSHLFGCPCYAPVVVSRLDDDVALGPTVPLKPLQATQNVLSPYPGGSTRGDLPQRRQR